MKNMLLASVCGLALLVTACGDDAKPGPNAPNVPNAPTAAGDGGAPVTKGSTPAPGGGW